MYEKIDKNEFKTLIVKSPSKLKKNQYKNFILTSLILNNQIYNEKDFIYLLNLEEINSYEIITSNEEIKLFEILKFALTEKSDIYSVIRIESSFLIYKDSKPYYFQKIDNNISNEELISYIKNRLKIDITNIIEINQNEFESFKQKQSLEKDKKLLLENINKYSSNQLKIYLLYIFFFICMIILYLFYINTNKTVDIEKISKTNYLEYQSFYKKFENIRLHLSENKLNLISFNYENNSLRLIFQSSKKDNIYKFLMEYKKLITDSSITYLVDLKKYECSVDVRKF